MKARGVFWFALGVALSLIVGVVGKPEAVVVLCLVIIIAALVVLAVSAFYVAERSDGRG